MDLRYLTTRHLGTLALALLFPSAAVEAKRPSGPPIREPVSAIQGPDGSFIYTFGQGSPTIHCAPLRICTVTFQPGESVVDFKIGDNVRWIVDGSVSGDSRGPREHLLVKPTEAGLSTSLVVTTDRRMYELQLVSHTSRYMANTVFRYPEDERRRFREARNRMLAKKRKSQKKREKEREHNTIPKTKDHTPDLDFGYAIRGSATWKPVRVYNDGRRTIIQMPQNIGEHDAPALLLVERKNWFRKMKRLVNYRIQGDRFVVDTLFNRAVLISGVGSRRERVTIYRRKRTR